MSWSLLFEFTLSLWSTYNSIFPQKVESWIMYCMCTILNYYFVTGTHRLKIWPYHLVTLKNLNRNGIWILLKFHLLIQIRVTLWEWVPYWIRFVNYCGFAIKSTFWSNLSINSLWKNDYKYRRFVIVFNVLLIINKIFHMYWIHIVYLWFLRKIIVQ